MIRFDITGIQVLLYEVPYISVPTIRDNEKLKDEEYEEIKDKNESGISIIVK
jgi:hypothetical protein